MAVSCGHEQVIQSLILHGAHINARDDDGDTPLHWAVRAENERLLELLVKSGANVDLSNEDDETPLDLAFCLGESKMCTLLAQHSKRHLQQQQQQPTLLGTNQSTNQQSPLFLLPSKERPMRGMETESLAPDYFTFA